MENNQNFNLTNPRDIRVKLEVKNITNDPDGPIITNITAQGDLLCIVFRLPLPLGIDNSMLETDIEINLPMDYPFQPPTSIRFVDQFHHPLIDPENGLMLNILDKNWTSVWGLKEIIDAVFMSLNVALLA